MTSRTFELIIARAIVDSDFRARLLADKQSVIKEYTLSAADTNAIQEIDGPTLEKAREIAAMVGVVHLRSGG